MAKLVIDIKEDTRKALESAVKRAGEKFMKDYVLKRLGLYGVEHNL